MNHRPPALPKSEYTEILSLSRGAKFLHAMIEHVGEFGNKRLTELGPTDKMSRGEQYKNISTILEIINLTHLHNGLAEYFWSILPHSGHDQYNICEVGENWKILGIYNKPISTQKVTALVNITNTLRLFLDTSRVLRLYQAGPN